MDGVTFSLATYSETALRGAITSLSFNGQWAERVEALLREKNRRKIEDRMSEEPSQYETVHRGCPL